MKHFRPIITFATWLLECVKVPMTEDQSLCADDYIQAEFKLNKATHGDLRWDIYLHWRTWSLTDVVDNSFYFPSAEMADRFHAKFGGERSTKSMENNPRTGEGISGNFTLDDLVYLYGDPLPNLIQFHLVDMQDRLSGYFDRFKFMHQHWQHGSHWIPSAFVYVDRTIEQSEAPTQWLFNMLDKPEVHKHAWQWGWEASIHGVYEFDDPSIAAMFKLAFGGGPIPSKLGTQRHDTYLKLVGPVSGIQPPKDRWGTWERQANIPDYRNPREVD